MAFFGALGVWGAALLAVAVAAVTLWSGWRALRGELLPGFRTVPPRPRAIVLTALGVVLPLLAVGAFALYLAVVLLQLGAAALS